MKSIFKEANIYAQNLHMYTYACPHMQVLAWSSDLIGNEKEWKLYVPKVILYSFNNEEDRCSFLRINYWLNFELGSEALSLFRTMTRSREYFYF